jgi:hypothetical protein
VPSPGRVARPAPEKAAQRHLVDWLDQHDAVVTSIQHPAVDKVRGGHRWAWPLLVAANAGLTGALSGGQPCRVEQRTDRGAFGLRAFGLATFRGVQETRPQPWVTIIDE